MPAKKKAARNRKWEPKQVKKILAEYKQAIKRGTGVEVLKTHGISRSHIYAWQRQLARKE
jgi:citrate lyase beta subunit